MLLTARHVAGECNHCGYRALCTFGNFSPRARYRLDEIGMNVTLPYRASVFRENEPADAVFMVCEGQVKLSASSRDGRVMILRLSGPGNILGLSAVLNCIPYEATAETLKPTILKKILRSDFLKFLQSYNEVSQETSHVLAKEYHELFVDARRLALGGSASGRLASLLLDWVHTTASGRPSMRFTMSLTHEEIANIVGTSRETVTRLLNQFEQDGLIARHGNSITVLNLVHLNLLLEKRARV